MRSKTATLVLIFLVLLTTGSSVRSQWFPDGNPVTSAWTTDDPQSGQCVVQDGEGGTIVVWHQPGDGIYAQRFRADGTCYWEWAEETGVFIWDSSETSTGISPHAVLMINGSLLIVWQKYDPVNHQDDIYAQRLDIVTGTLSWASDGKTVCDQAAHQFRPRATEEGIIFWLDNRDGSAPRLYMQRLDSSGSRQWGNGNPVVDRDCIEYDFQVAAVPNFRTSGYSGGYLVVFTGRSEWSGCFPVMSRQVIRAQWVTSWGATPWGSEGMFVLWEEDTECRSFKHPRVVGDEATGYARAYIVAEGHSSYSNQSSIYAAGIYQDYTHPKEKWRKCISEPLDDPTINVQEKNPQIAMTGGQLVCTWEKVQGSQVHLYARRFSRLGVLGWSPEQHEEIFGMPVCSDYSPVYEHSIALSGLDRITVTWKYGNDIYARSIKTSGDVPEILTDAADEMLCLSNGVQMSPGIVSDSEGGAYVAWKDYRHDNSYPRIYMSRLDPPGRYCELFAPKSILLALGSPLDLVVRQETFPGSWGDLIRIDNIDIFASYDGAEFTLIDGASGIEISRVEEDILWVPWDVSGFVSDNCRLAVRIHYNDNITAWDESESVVKTGHYSVDWASNGYPVAAEPGEQSGSRLTRTSDGAYIVTWEGAGESMGVDNNDMFASKISIDGDHLWDPPIAALEIGYNYYDEHSHDAASDGSGGAFVVCVYEKGTDNQLLAYHLDSAGGTDWVQTVREASGLNQFDPVIAPDGGGGSFIAWYEHNLDNYDLFIRLIHLDADGSTASGWPDGGKSIFYGSVIDDVEIEILTLGADECLVAYTKQSYSDNIFLRRVSGSSTGAEFPVSSSDIYAHRHPCLVPDAGTGFYVVWQEYSAYYMGEVNIYAQRIGLSGNGFERLWAGYGLPVCNWSGKQYWPRAVEDGAGGFVVVWHDNRTGDQYDIYAERVDQSGNKLWGITNPDFSGIPVCEAEGDQFYQEIVNVGSGQFIVAWVDGRDLLGTECKSVYAEKIDTDGTLLWGDNGRLVSGSVDYRSDNFQPITMLDDGENGTIIAWDDARYAFPVEEGPDAPVLDVSDVRIQRISGSAFFPICESVEAWIVNGDSVWATGDELLLGCPDSDRDDYHLLIRCIFDETGMDRWGWLDPADFTIDTGGMPFSFCSLGEPDTAGTPENGYSVNLVRTQIRGCSGCAGDGCSSPTVPEYDVSVLFQGLEIGVIQDLKVRSIDVNNDGQVNLSEFSLFGVTYNKVLGDPGYNGCFDFNVDDKVNLSDFSLLGHHYQHEDSCYTAEHPPAMMLDMESRIALNGDASVSESDPDVIRVALKLGNISDITTAALTFEYSTEVMVFRRWVPSQGLRDKTAVLPSVEEGKGKLLVAAFGMDGSSDLIHELGYLEFYSENDPESIVESCDSDDEEGVLVLVTGEALDESGRILRIGEITGSGEMPTFNNGLGNNYPNPFNPATVIEYSLANDSEVELAIYNVNGQRVRTLVNARKTKGTHTVMWDGKNNGGQQVASGVYFCRIKTEKFTDSRKMILLR